MYNYSLPVLHISFQTKLLLLYERELTLEKIEGITNVP